MKTRQRLHSALGLLTVALWLTACSDDHPVAPPAAGDTTPPEVIATFPGDGYGGFDLFEPLAIHFSEAMDPASAAGQLTLAGAAITVTAWQTDRILVVRHEEFTEGADITLTVGTGLTDAAGNNLAADHVARFRTTSSSELVLMRVSPADGSTGVPVNAGISLRFSEYVETTQVENEVHLSDRIATGTDKADFAFTVRSMHYNTFLLTPDADLPAGTQIQVTVSDRLTASWGQTPADTLRSTFTTGATRDTTPPEIIAVEPAAGASGISPDQGFLRLTFSEPINRIRLNRYNLAWMVLVQQSGESVGQWNADLTQLTLGLPSGLPAGMPIDLTYDAIEDFNGVQRPEPFLYQVRVAGDPDYVPYADGDRFQDETEWVSGPLGGPGETDDGYERRWILMVFRDAGTWHETVCFTPNPAGDPFDAPTGEWEAYRETGDALQWLGWQEAPDPVKSNDFEVPLMVLPLPPAESTWDAGSPVVAGGNTWEVDLAGRVLRRQDYAIPEYGGRVFIKDAWITVLDFTWEQAGVTAVTRRDTVFYAPCLGPVKTVGFQEDHGGGTWRRDVTWRRPFSEFPLR